MCYKDYEILIDIDEIKSELDKNFITKKYHKKENAEKIIKQLNKENNEWEEFKYRSKNKIEKDAIDNIKKNINLFINDYKHQIELNYNKYRTLNPKWNSLDKYYSKIPYEQNIYYYKLKTTLYSFLTKRYKIEKKICDISHKILSDFKFNKCIKYKGLEFELLIKIKYSDAGLCYDPDVGYRVKILNLIKYVSLKISDSFLEKIKNEYHKLTENDPTIVKQNYIIERLIDIYKSN